MSDSTGLVERISAGTCGGYDYVTFYAPDISDANTWYYDPVTGQAVAAVNDSQGQRKCYAGPSDFTPPTCNGSLVPACDAGSE
jgi:hypothetical protein